MLLASRRALLHLRLLGGHRHFILVGCRAASVQLGPRRPVLRRIHRVRHWRARIAKSSSRVGGKFFGREGTLNVPFRALVQEAVPEVCFEQRRLVSLVHWGEEFPSLTWLSAFLFSHGSSTTACTDGVGCIASSPECFSCWRGNATLA